jgi:hypothetical protein
MLLMSVMVFMLETVSVYREELSEVSLNVSLLNRREQDLMSQKVVVSIICSCPLIAGFLY